MLDRIEAQVERFAPGFHDLVLERSALGPADLEAKNRNLVGGDLNVGAMDLGQLFTRPARKPSPTGRRSRACTSARPRRRPAAGSTGCAAGRPRGSPSPISAGGLSSAGSRGQNHEMEASIREIDGAARRSTATRGTTPSGS